MQQLFSLSLDITAVRFDTKGHSYPSRITLGGRTIYPTFHEGSGAISFSEAGKEVWLRRRGKSWYMITELTS